MENISLFWDKLQILFISGKPGSETLKYNIRNNDEKKTQGILILKICCYIWGNCTRYVKIVIHYIKYEENASDFNIDLLGANQWT